GLRLRSRLAHVLVGREQEEEREDHAGETRRTGKCAFKAVSARSRASSPKARITAQSPPPAPLGFPAAPADAARAQARASSVVMMPAPESSPSYAIAAAADRTASSAFSRSPDSTAPRSDSET